MNIDAIAVSVLDGAKCIGVSRSKIYEMFAAKELVPIKLGSRTLIPYCQLKALIEKASKATAWTE